MPGLNHSVLGSSNPKDQGYFTDPKISANVHQILELIPVEESSVLSAQFEQLHEITARLQSAVDALKLEQSSYDFRDYPERLLLSEEEIMDLLNQEILNTRGVETPV